MPGDAADTQVDVLIIGGGPTGLGAATRLHQHKHPSWLLVDEAETAGGLACTDVTQEGFLFDMGGHVIFSHYQYFDDLLDSAYGRGDTHWNSLQRVSYVRYKRKWVAYPFQNNISALGPEDQIVALNGMVEAKAMEAVAAGKPATFDEWILRRMGSGIADMFMRPYNFKVWAVPTTQMQAEWLGERVATVDVGRAVANVIHQKEDAGWGPNAVFRFPKQGGTGGIWKAVAAALPAERQRYDCRVTALDQKARCATLADGSTVQYKALVSTMPLDTTLRWFGQHTWADSLTHSSSHIIGIGVRGSCPHGSKCWLYFPEDNCPFYRATVFSNYAESNCPPADAVLPNVCMGDGSGDGGGPARAGPYWSLMFEVSESSQKPVEWEEQVQLGSATVPRIVMETVQGAVNTSLISPDDEIVSVYYRRLEHGYPVPTLERDAALAQALPWLKQHGIWSRGRFGSYKYEVANQDHSLMLGVECVDNILFGSKEVTLHHPNLVNSERNVELLYNRIGWL